MAAERGIRVLLVEDNPAEARLVLETLSEAGRPLFDVVVADRLAKGIEELDRGGFDVAIVDLALPDSQGLETFIKIRDRARSIPVLVLTGLSSDEIGRQAVRQGAQDFLHKGEMRSGDLVRSILYALSRQQLISQLEEHVSALAASEERYRVVTAAAQDAIITIDEADHIMFANDAAETLFGYKREELREFQAAALVPERSREALLSSLSPILAAGPEVLRRGSVAIEGLRKDGRTVPLDVTFGVTEQGGKKFLTAVLRDDTIRYRAQEAQERLSNMVGASKDAIYSMEADGTIKTWNPAASTLYGYTAEEAQGTSVFKLVPPHKTAEMRAVLARIGAGEGGVHFETVRRRKDGHPVEVALTMSALRDVAGRTIGISTIARDISERKRADLAVRRRTVELAALYEASFELSQTLDLDRIYAVISDLVSKVLACDGLSVSYVESGGQTLTCAFVFKDGASLDPSSVPPLQLAPEGESPESRVIASGRSLIKRDREVGAPTSDQPRQALEDPKRTVPASGAPRPTRPSVLVPLKLEGKVTGIMEVHTSVGKDYTEHDLQLLETFALHVSNAIANARLFSRVQYELEERSKAELALKASEEKYRGMVETAQEGICVLDADRRMVFANAKMAELLGLSLQDVVGVSPLDLMDDAGKETAAVALVQDTPSGGRATFEVRLRRKDGSSRLVLVGTSPLADAHGGPAGTLLMVTDVTEQRSIGKLRDEILDVISHEFRTPVTVIQGYAQILSSTGGWEGPPEGWKRAAERIEQSSQQLGFLLASIRELAGLRTGTPIARTETLETASVLHEAAKVLGWRHPAHDASISITIDPSSEKCLGDRQKLVMAVGELLDNAVKFSPVGSKVFVSATSRGNEMVISVADEGPGFPDAAKKNMGLPFWQGDMTAARQTGGAGLGLALVVGLVAAHGGHVDVESVEGKGSRVNIHLPGGSKTDEEPPQAQGVE